MKWLQHISMVTTIWLVNNWRLVALFICVFAFTFFDCYDADPNPPHLFTYYQDRVIAIALEFVKVVGAIYLLACIFLKPPKIKTML